MQQLADSLEQRNGTASAPGQGPLQDPHIKTTTTIVDDIVPIAYIPLDYCCSCCCREVTSSACSLLPASGALGPRARPVSLDCWESSGMTSVDNDNNNNSSIGQRRRWQQQSVVEEEWQQHSGSCNHCLYQNMSTHLRVLHQHAQLLQCFTSQS